MRTVVLRVAGLLAPVLLAPVLAGCASGGAPVPPPVLGTSGASPSSSPSPSERTLDAPKPAAPDPADVVSAVRDAAQRAGSVVVTRTTQDGDDWTHEEVEVAFASPPSARVLHVGEDIWTLSVVTGEGYLKDQTTRKSTSRWTRLSAAETTERLEDVTLDGLLGVLDHASTITRTEKATLGARPVTCHSLVLSPHSDADADTDPVPQSARICVDADRRPVELVVTADDEVTTSRFTGWGSAVEALPPPPGLVD